MDYVIKIGNEYVGCNSQGTYTETKDINQAIRGTMHRLTNIVNNSISPSKRSKCKVIPVNSVKVTPVKCSSIASNVSDTESLFDSTLESLKKIDVTSFNREHGAVSQRLSAIDQEICDIQHYIEFNQFNAADGYKAYKLLHSKLKERRIIKNDFQKFQILSDSKVSDIFDGTLDKRLRETDNKVYTPRVLKDLF